MVIKWVGGFGGEILTGYTGKRMLLGDLAKP